MNTIRPKTPLGRVAIKLPWCGSATELVKILGDACGAANILVRSPHHVQVRLDEQLHNVWIDSGNTVKYQLAEQGGAAVVASTRRHLVEALSGFESGDSDLSKMRQTLELSELIAKSKLALPFSGLTRAVFVDAGFKEGHAQIAVVEVAHLAKGEYVRAESRPVDASQSNAAELLAIQFAADWSDQDCVIFSDNRGAVDVSRKTLGDRIRWLPREQNKVADKLANVRSPKKKKRRSKSKKRPPGPSKAS